MKASGHVRLRREMLLLFVLFGVAILFAAIFYGSQARQHVGADYTAMVADVVRAQEDPVKLRLALDGFLDSREALHLQQINQLLWLIPQRMDGIRHLLRQSELPRGEYRPVLDELAHVEGLLPDFEQRVEDAIEGQGDAEPINVMGMEIEESLAWGYSELNELLHAAAAEQRQKMQWLSMAVVVLVVLVLLVIGSLMVALLRIHQHRELLHHQNQTDALTGLFNRRKLYEVADREFARHKRSGNPLSLVLIDLDHFKHINDRFGHPTGDAVLIAFARTVADEVREMDYAVRMGGEEFAILMPDTDQAGALQLAERLRVATQALELPGAARGHAMTASFGIATADEGIDAFDQLYPRADTLLYLAKSRGRNRCEGDCQ